MGSWRAFGEGLPGGWWLPKEQLALSGPRRTLYILHGFTATSMSARPPRTWAVHGLEAELRLLHLEREHVLAVVVRVARRAPQVEVVDVGGHHLLVLVLPVLLAAGGRKGRMLVKGQDRVPTNLSCLRERQQRRHMQGQRPLAAVGRCTVPMSPCHYLIVACGTKAAPWATPVLTLALCHSGCAFMSLALPLASLLTIKASCPGPEADVKYVCPCTTCAPAHPPAVLPTPAHRMKPTRLL